MGGTLFRFFLAGMLALALGFPASAMANGAERQALNGINSIRAKHGLGPLRNSPALGRSAQAQSNLMLATDRIAHGARLSAAGHWSILGENIAMHRGWKPRVRWLLRAWMNSPVHRHIILSGKYRYAGLGATRGRYGRWKATTWTLRVGRR